MRRWNSWRPSADRAACGHHRRADRLRCAAIEGSDRRSRKRLKVACPDGAYLVTTVEARRLRPPAGRRRYELLLPIVFIFNPLTVNLLMTLSLPPVHCRRLASRTNWLSEGGMASQPIDFCEPANPRVLDEVRRVNRFENARRIHNGLTSNWERRALTWMAERTPGLINSDHLTILGLLAQVMAGVSYALARWNR